MFHNIPKEGRSQLPIVSFDKLFRPFTVKHRLFQVHNKSIQYLILSTL